MSTIDCILSYMAGGVEVSSFQGVREAWRSWYLAQCSGNAKIGLPLFVVLPRIGKKKLQTSERMRKTAIKNRNKKQRAANSRSLLPGLYPPPGTSPN
jgi:hypothetical protein